MRHDHVREHEIDPAVAFRNKFQCFLAVGGLQHAIAKRAQDAAAQIADDFLVLHDKDRFCSLLEFLLQFHRHRVGRGDHTGQPYPDFRPRAELAADFDVSAALIDDAIDGRQAEAGPLALGFRGEERLEDMAQHLPAHPCAVVPDGELEVVARLDIEACFAELLIQRVACRADCQLASARHGVPRVDGQVHDDLLQQARVHAHAAGLIVEEGDQLDILAERAPQELVHLHDHGVGVQDADLDDLLAAEGQQLTGQVRGALARADDLLDGVPERVVLSELVENHAAEPEDGGHDVVEVVRDAAGQPANGLHLLRLQVLLLHLQFARDVALDADVIDNRPVLVAGGRDDGVACENGAVLLPVLQPSPPGLFRGQGGPHGFEELGIVPAALEEIRIFSHHFGAGIARDAFEGGVDIQDGALGVRDDDGVRRLLDGHRKLGAFRFELFSQRDVVDKHEIGRLAVVRDHGGVHLHGDGGPIGRDQDGFVRLRHMFARHAAAIILGDAGQFGRIDELVERHAGRDGVVVPGHAAELVVRENDLSVLDDDDSVERPLDHVPVFFLALPQGLLHLAPLDHLHDQRRMIQAGLKRHGELGNDIPVLVQVLLAERLVARDGEKLQQADVPEFEKGEHAFLDPLLGDHRGEFLLGRGDRHGVARAEHRQDRMPGGNRVLAGPELWNGVHQAEGVRILAGGGHIVQPAHVPRPDPHGCVGQVFSRQERPQESRTGGLNVEGLPYRERQLVENRYLAHDAAG